MHNTVHDKVIYDEAKQIHDIFTPEENLNMMNHEFDSQENEALNKANTKLALKNMFFSRSRSLSDHLCLVIAYASIGYFDTISRLLQLLVNNENYILEPIASAWAKQQDTQWAKKKKREQTPRAKAMWSTKRKETLKENWSNNKTSKKAGDIYEHGHAVPIPNQDIQARIDPNQQEIDNLKKWFIGFQFDEMTGYPINPKTGQHMMVLNHIVWHAIILVIVVVLSMVVKKSIGMSCKGRRIMTTTMHYASKWKYN